MEPTALHAMAARRSCLTPGGLTMARLRATRRVDYHNTIRIDTADPANRQLLETLRACRWGEVNQTITQALRIGVAQLALARSTSPTEPARALGRRPDAPEGRCEDAAASLARRQQQTTEPEPSTGRPEAGLKPKPPSTHQKVVGMDPTQARRQVIDMVAKLTGKRRET